jgi:hypothetical protein
VLHITGDDRGGAVRGGVVDDDRLPIHYFLIEEAIECARQRHLRVVRRNHD